MGHDLKIEITSRRNGDGLISLHTLGHRQRFNPVRQDVVIALVSLEPGHGRRAAGTSRENEWAASSAAITVPTVNLNAVAFSKQWVGAWNAHDVESVLEHFHENVVFTSPVAAKLLPETTGIVHGKPALRRYWTVALQRIPNLRFVIEGVYQGIDTIVIMYRNQDDHLVNEVLRFNDDVVIEGHGTYLVPA